MLSILMIFLLYSYEVLIAFLLYSYSIRIIFVLYSDSMLILVVFYSYAILIIFFIMYSYAILILFLSYPLLLHTSFHKCIATIFSGISFIEFTIFGLDYRLEYVLFSQKRYTKYIWRISSYCMSTRSTYDTDK